MGFKGDSCMDCGSFMGDKDGLVWFPPKGHPEEGNPKLIPWDIVLPNDEPKQESKEEE